MRTETSRLRKNIRETIYRVIDGYVYGIYVSRNKKHPNFEKDEEYEVSIDFKYEQEVKDLYTDTYYNETRHADCIRLALDGMIYLNDADDMDAEKDIKELTTDELFSLAEALELKHNKIR